MLLSREECEQILQTFLVARKKKRTSLVNYEVIRDGSAIGYLGDYYALILSYADEKTIVKQTLFIKALPQSSAEVNKVHIFRKEAWLYGTLLADMQKYSKVKWSPYCYYSRDDLCVLEDLKQSDYHLILGPCEELGETPMFQLLGALAAFHAASLTYEQREEKSIGTAFGSQLHEITVAPDISWFTTGLAAILTILNSMPQYQKGEHANFINERLLGLLEHVYAQTATSTKYCNVLCHRDTWAGNIFYPSDSSGASAAVLVDFQTCRYCPPAIDLTMALHLNLTVKERKCKEWKYLDFYYDTLATNLNQFDLNAAQLLPKSELHKSYHEFRLFGLVYQAIAMTIIKVPVEYVTNEFKYIERGSIILKYMTENKDFDKCIRECCVEVFEMALSMTT